MKLLSFCKLTIVLSILNINEGISQKEYRPVIDGDWWSVAETPDLGEYNSKDQEPVDFGLWQAADGTWQLWSCIRGTKAGEKNRLFYKWEGEDLLKKDWDPKGIAMEADTTLGEVSGGLQAPYVLKKGKLFYMFYGDWNRICLAKSEDGKKFTRVLNKNGDPSLFSGPYYHARDPMVVFENGLYHCYYMGHTTEQGEVQEEGQIVKKRFKNAIFCRTSSNLSDWSEPIMISAGGIHEGKAAFFGGDAECPFIVKRGDYYYLFRNVRYGLNSLNIQYASKNPFSFGIGHDNKMVGELPIAAPEIVFHDDQYYIAALKPELNGIQIAKLKWIEVD